MGTKFYRPKRMAASLGPITEADKAAAINRARGVDEAAIGAFPGLAAHGTAVYASSRPKGLGDFVSSFATPVARALHLGCVDPSTGELRPESGCAGRRDALNRFGWAVKGVVRFTRG